MTLIHLLLHRLEVWREFSGRRVGDFCQDWRIWTLWGAAGRKTLLRLRVQLGRLHRLPQRRTSQYRPACARRIHSKIDGRLFTAAAASSDMRRVTWRQRRWVQTCLYRNRCDDVRELRSAVRMWRTQPWSSRSSAVLHSAGCRSVHLVQV